MTMNKARELIEQVVAGADPRALVEYQEWTVRVADSKKLTGWPAKIFGADNSGYKVKASTAEAAVQMAADKAQYNPRFLKATQESVDEAKQWGLRWFEFDKNDRRVQKEKWFASEAARKSFADKLETKDNFAGDYTYSEES